jgi:hypothetical protein
MSLIPPFTVVIIDIIPPLSVVIVPPQVGGKSLKNYGKKKYFGGIKVAFSHPSGLTEIISPLSFLFFHWLMDYEYYPLPLQDFSTTSAP